MQNEFWEQNAENWAFAMHSNSISSRSITNPTMVNEILKFHVHSILDVGCGEGWLGTELKKTYNMRYKGIDGSAALIKIAKARESLSFEQVTYEALVKETWKSSEKYDGICFNFSLFDEDVVPLLRSTSHFLNAQGLLFIQTLHPCFAVAPYQNAWKVDNFQSMPVNFKNEMPWYGRTLGSWVDCFNEAGLTIKGITEPSQNEVPVSILFVLQCAKGFL